MIRDVTGQDPYSRPVTAVASTAAAMSEGPVVGFGRPQLAGEDQAERPAVRVAPGETGILVDVSDGDLPVRRGWVVPERELRWRFSRASGPGGQGVNTTDSRVELSFDLAGSPGVPDHLRERAGQRLRNRLVEGVLTVVASEHRSQLRNREAARARLTILLREATDPDPPTRRPTKPSKGARRRRTDAKTRRGAIKKLRGRPEE